MEFPAPYTLKVIGNSEDDFPSLVRAELLNHMVDDYLDLEVRPSKKGTFVSVNVSFTATGEPQLEAIHQSLNATGKVKLIL